MKILTGRDTLSALCKASNSYGMYLSWCTDPSPYIGAEDYVTKIIESAPYLTFDKNFQTIFDGNCWILFDSQDEMEAAFNVTRGDDSNLSNTDISIYAMTCGPDGLPMNENT